MGSSGGGGASGAVSHSAYLEKIHSNWLDNTGVDVLTKSITDVMELSIGNSPWTTLSAYNPAVDIAGYETELTLFKTLLSGLSDTADWAALYAQADLTIAGAADVAILADAAAFAAILDADLNTKILPRFRRGMQDINAVVSSAFVIGGAVIEGFRDRELAKHTSVLRLDTKARTLTAVEQMMQLMGRRISWNESYSRTLIEASRIKIVAMKEQHDRDALIDVSDAKWDIEVFQGGANLLAAIGGGTVVPNMPGTDRTASTLGGAMAIIGAAAALSN